jgi:mRNA interferase MazF
VGFLGGPKRVRTRPSKTRVGRADRQFQSEPNSNRHHSCHTSNIKLAQAPGNVLLRPRESGLPKTSVVNVAQLLTVDKSYLTECVGTLPQHILRLVNRGLRLVLAL